MYTFSGDVGGLIVDVGRLFLKRARTVFNSPCLPVAGTILGIGLLIRTIDFPKAVVSLGGADLRWIVGALALTAVAVLASVVEWGVLIRTSRSAVPAHASLFTWPRLSSSYLQSLFFTQVIPAGVGGDAVRTVEMGKHVGHSRVLASLAGSRMAGLLGMAAWGLAAAVLLRDWLGNGVYIGLAAMVAVMVVVWVSALGADRLGPHRLVERVSGATGRAGPPLTHSFFA